MIENATNLTNTTGLVDIVEGFFVGLLPVLKTVLTFLLGFLLGSGVIAVVLNFLFNKKLQKSQQEYEEKLRRQAKDRRRANKMLGHFIIPLIKDLDKKIQYISNTLNREGFINPTQSPLKPKYEFAYANSILKKEDDTWIREKVDKYNELAKGIDDYTVLNFRQAIRETIKQMFPDDMDIPNKDMEFLEYLVVDNNITSVDNEGDVYKFWKEHIDEFSKIRDSRELQYWINEIKRCLGEAKEVATKLKDGLEKLKEQYEDTHDIEEDEIEVVEEKEKSSRGLI